MRPSTDRLSLGCAAAISAASNCGEPRPGIWPRSGQYLGAPRSGRPRPACCSAGGNRRVGSPAQVERFSGTLPRRDASETEADVSLRRTREPWPAVTTLEGASVYRARFKQGATIVPRRFFLAERDVAGRLGDNPAAPRVRGKTGALDRAPWRGVDPPHGAVEIEFLRPVLLGESVAPFRLRTLALAVIPIDGGALLDAAAATNGGYRHFGRMASGY